MLSCLLFSCDSVEQRQPTEAQFLAEYKVLFPFVLDKQEFRGIIYDIDTGYFEFAIKSEILSSAEYFQKVKSQLLESQWWLIEENSDRLTYISKNRYQNNANMPYLKVTIEYLENSKEFKIVCTPIYKPASHEMPPHEAPPSLKERRGQ